MDYEPESQIEPPIHSQPLEKWIEDDDDITNQLKNDKTDKEELTEEELPDYDDASLFPHLHEPNLPQETQQNSFGSVVEETQFADIEMDTQESQTVEPLTDTPVSLPKTLQNDDQSVNDSGSKSLFGPPKLFVRPAEPETIGFKYTAAKPLSKQNLGPKLQDSALGATENLKNSSRAVVPIVQESMPKSTSNRLPQPSGNDPAAHNTSVMVAPVESGTVLLNQPANRKIDFLATNNNKEVTRPIPSTGIPSANHHRKPRGRKQSFKTPLAGPTRKTGPPPFPDVYKQTTQFPPQSAQLPQYQLPPSGQKTLESGADLAGTIHAEDVATESNNAQNGVVDLAARANSKPNIQGAQSSNYVASMQQQSCHQSLQTSATFRPSSVNSNIYANRDDHAHSSRPASRMDYSRPHSRANQARPVSRSQHRFANRPITANDLKPQSILETSRPDSNRVIKTTNARTRYDEVQTPDHFAKQYQQDAIYAHNMVEQIHQQRMTIQSRENEIFRLKTILQDTESKLSDSHAINSEFEARRKELSKKVEDIKALSNKYKEHINGVVICQKKLKSGSDSLKDSVKTLHDQAKEQAEQELATREAQIARLGKLLKEIKEARRLEDERDRELLDTKEQVKQLGDSNNLLKADIEQKLVELQQERRRIEQLQKQLTDGAIHRHKELMDILQKPQVNPLEALCAKDGMLKQIFDNGNTAKEQLNELSKTITDTANREPEWPQTLSKILEDFYTRLQTKLDDNDNKDSAFQESSLKLFEDLQERLNQIHLDQAENTKLNERLTESQESNANLRAKLESKDSESAANRSRLEELTRQLVDVQSQLTSKSEQLAIAISQPREDPDMKLKFHDLSIETSKLQALLVTAKDGKRESLNNLRVCQETLSESQRQLREVEGKLTNAETALRELETKSNKFQTDCKNATEKVRQDTTKIAISQRKELIEKHDALIEELERKHAQKEIQLKVALEETKTTKEENAGQAKLISKLQLEMTVCKEQLQEQKSQLEDLDRRNVLAPAVLEQVHEMRTIRQDIADQKNAIEALRVSSSDFNEILSIRGEIEDKLKEENTNIEQLKQENEQLRKKVADLETQRQHQLASSSVNYKNNSRRFDVNVDRESQSPGGYINQSSRKAITRKPGNVQKHQTDGVVPSGTRNHQMTAEANNLTGSTSNRLRMSGGGVNRSRTPMDINKYKIVSSSSPLTDIEVMIEEFESVNSQEKLQQSYIKARKLSSDTGHGDGSEQSKYYSHRNQFPAKNAGTNDKMNGKIMLVSDGASVNTPTRLNVPTHAEESRQRRTSKPLRSAMKQTDSNNATIRTDSKSSATIQNLTPQNVRKNAGLNPFPRSSVGNYNRIAAGKLNNVAPEPAPLLKRQRSISLHHKDQSTRPAKAPRISLHQPSSQTVIPDSQDGK